MWEFLIQDGTLQGLCTLVLDTIVTDRRLCNDALFPKVDDRILHIVRSLEPYSFWVEKKNKMLLPAILWTEVLYVAFLLYDVTLPETHKSLVSRDL